LSPYGFGARRLFPIPAKGATIEGLKVDLDRGSCSLIFSHHSETQAGRLCYFSLGLSATHVAEPIVS
jgi:hypothetical protein